jgi:3-hydroxybutyryl-CoA dehydratase
LEEIDMMGKTIDQLEIGEKASIRKTFTESDVYSFAQISGDTNPLHIDKEYASGSLFRERVVHGMLTAGLISAVLGTHLPGVGSIYLSQSLRFTAPVKFGDTIEAEVEVVAKIEEKKQVRLRTICRNQRGQTVIDGEALVMPPRKSP